MTWRKEWEEGGLGGGGMGGGLQLAFPRMGKALKILLLINVAVFLANFLFFLATGQTFAPYLGLSLDSASERPFLAVLQLITYQFTHALDPWHLLMNGLMLYFFGSMVEQRYGQRHLLRLYLLSGIAGGVFWLVFSGLVGHLSGVPVIGASGAAYGILVFAAFMSPHSRVLLFILFVPLWAVAALLGFLALYETLVAYRVPGGGVAHAAHLGGALFGLLWWQLRPWLQQQRFRLQAREQQKGRQRELDEQEEVDRLLAKVKREGMASLSKSERKTLTRYSEKLKR